MDKYTKIKQLFEQNRDEENAVKMSKYMRDLFKFYGLATPLRKSFYKDLLKEENQKYNEYDDCGCLLYDVTQNVYQGGSGPVCNALVSFGYIYQMILKGKYKRVLVLATGALLNPVMTNQKLSIPCVCHGYVLEGVS